MASNRSLKPVKVAYIRVIFGPDFQIFVPGFSYICVIFVLDFHFAQFVTLAFVKHGESEKLA